VVNNLGAGVPATNNRFADRVNHLRLTMLQSGLATCGPPELIRKQKDELRQREPEMQRWQNTAQQLWQQQLQQMQRRQQLVLRQQQEEVLLDVQERRLAQQLFQQSSLNVVLRKLPDDSTDVLCAKLRADSPLIRLLVVHAIGRRHLHLEPELIACLHDPVPEVRQGARQALIRVARGTDFGPLPGWSRVGITRSVERWQHWLALQQADSLDPLAQSRPVGKPASGNPAQTALASPGLMIEKVLAPTISTLEAVDPRAGKLSAELVEATGAEQAELLARLRDAKGVEHTDALARAIPQLVGDARARARAALVQRLTRMTAQTLRSKFDEDDVEVRRAAALACARKAAQEHVPDLLELLNDPEAVVVQAGRQALKELTGQDFGPEAGAGPGEHARAVAAWYDWWRKRPADGK
jgi:hypothetical protein